MAEHQTYLQDRSHVYSSLNDDGDGENDHDGHHHHQHHELGRWSISC